MHRHRWRSRSSCRSPDINLQRLRKTASATRLCQPSSNLDMSARYRAWVGAHLLSAPLKTPKSLLNTALGESAHTPSGPMVVSKPRRCGSCRRPVGARECLFHAQAVAGTEQNATVDTPLRVLSVGFRFASIHDLSISQAAPQARMTLLSQSAGRERPTSVAKPGSASPPPAVRSVRSWRCGNPRSCRPMAAWVRSVRFFPPVHVARSMATSSRLDHAARQILRRHDTAAKASCGGNPIRSSSPRPRITTMSRGGT